VATVCFATLFVVLPPVVVVASPGLDEEAFVCRARIESRLAETMQGKFEFFLTEGLEGDPPAGRFVITIDHDYTSGLEAVALGAGESFWLQGSLMDRDTYYGEQYLFFGYPQLFVSQVKGGLFWPSQVARLRSLYAAPLEAPLSVYLIGAFPFMEEYSSRTWALVIARFVLVFAAVAAAVLYRRRRRRWMPGLVWVLGAYVVASVVLAVPGL